jgi:hypothetical protein
MNDSELKLKAIEILSKNLGLIETERFIALIQKDKFDYTKWRENLFKGLSGEEISKLAMEQKNKIDNH